MGRTTTIQIKFLAAFFLIFGMAALLVVLDVPLIKTYFPYNSISFLIYFLVFYAGISILEGVLLLQVHSSAYKLGILLSIFLLLNAPVGTIFGIAGIYILRKNKSYFENQKNPCRPNAPEVDITEDKKSFVNELVVIIAAAIAGGTILIYFDIFSDLTATLLGLFIAALAIPWMGYEESKRKFGKGDWSYGVTTFKERYKEVPKKDFMVLLLLFIMSLSFSIFRRDVLYWIVTAFFLIKVLSVFKKLSQKRPEEEERARQLMRWQWGGLSIFLFITGLLLFAVTINSIYEFGFNTPSTLIMIFYLITFVAGAIFWWRYYYRKSQTSSNSQQAATQSNQADNTHDLDAIKKYVLQDINKGTNPSEVKSRLNAYGYNPKIVDDILTKKNLTR